MRTLLFPLLLLIHAAQGVAQPSVVQTQLDNYREAFPEISFLYVDNQSALDSLLPLKESLGPTLSNLDYEHPESLRIQLVEVQEYRIGYQLAEDAGSSTLFSTPDESYSAKPYTCLLTLPSTLFSDDKLAASRYIYGLSEKHLESLPQARLIDDLQFQQYAIDHEVFHCVDAYLFGARYPMTADPLVASGDRYRAETRAEAFASLSHLERYPDGQQLLSNMAIARTIGLLHWDVEHYTAPLLQYFSDLKRVQSLSPDLQQRARNVTEPCERLAYSVQEYQRFLVTAYHALQALGIDLTSLPEEFMQLASETADTYWLGAMLESINEALDAIRAVKEQKSARESEST